jgi:uncharacterized protein YdeI (YjbR/CyaY-like superfamily)
MGARDPRVDAYIERSEGFARPILSYLRELVHEVAAEATETMKWSFPHFEQRGILCSMAAFKRHCAFGFWKASLLFGETAPSGEAMGQLGRITSLEDLPPREELVRLLEEAVRLNEEGVKAGARSKAPRPAPETPEDLAAALAENPAAEATFEGFPPSHRREYVEWITEARTAPTRQRRLDQAVAWMAEGKSRHWKYQRR